MSTSRYGPCSWAVVTGSTDGIGKAVALELAERGFNIVLIARNIDKLDRVAKKIQEIGSHTRIICFDLSETSVDAY